MDTETDYERQLDPELLAYIEAQRAAEYPPDPEPSDEADPEIAALMEEQPHGENHGRSAPSDPGEDEPVRWNSLNSGTWRAHDLLRSEGDGVVDTSRGSSEGSTYGARDAGMHAHRGVLRGDEWIEYERLAKLAEERLGASREMLRAVYGGRAGGPLPGRLMPIRNAVDRRLATVENIALLAEWLGLQEITEALRRGRTRGLRA
jgi:hypothetical protein